MNRSKRLLSLLLAVMLILTTVVSTTIVSTSATGTLSSYYSTNPNGQVGVKKTISVDDSISDWDSSMLIAQGTANDDPRVYRPNSMYEIPHDTYALYGAYDDSNIYLMWEMVNVQDVVAPADTYPLSQGVMFQTMNIPFFIAIDTGKSDVVGNNGALTTGGTIWDSGITISTQFNRLIAISTNGSNGPFLYSGDSTGLNPKEIAARAETGIQFGYGLGILSSSVKGIDKAYGTNNNRVVGDMCNESAAWVDFNTLGHSSSTMDFHYEIAIPYTALGITAADVEANGVGAMVILTSGKSGMDCLPYDLCMNDQADLDDAAGSQEFNSFEKSDEDNITVPFARIGKAGGNVNPPVDPPIATEPTTTRPTTAEPVVTQPTTAEPVVTQPTTAEPVVTEPSEAITTAPTPTEKPTDPIVVPPTPTTAPTEPSEVITVPTPTVPVPTLDFGDDTTPTETTPSTSIVVVEKGILGDADGNNAINIKDATAIQKHLAKLTTLEEDAQFLADVDANEVLNIRDATNIQKWIAKMDVDYAIGEPVVDEEIIIPVPTTGIVVPTTVVTEPTTVTAPIVVEPTTEVTEPTTAEPTTEATEPTTAEPVVTEPVVTEPVVTDPIETEPVVTEPIVTDPPYTEPIVTDPPYTEPPYSEPVTDPIPPVGGGKTVYFSNNKGWGTVNAYTWAEGIEGTWPGTAMTLVGQNEFGEDIYSFVVPDGHNMIIFNDGTSQTVDINLNELPLNGFYPNGDSEGKFTVGNYEYLG